MLRVYLQSFPSNHLSQWKHLNSGAVPPLGPARTSLCIIVNTFLILHKGLRIHRQTPDQMFHRTGLVVFFGSWKSMLLNGFADLCKNNSASVFFNPCLILSSTSHASSQVFWIILLHVFPLVIVMVRTSYAR